MESFPETFHQSRKSFTEKLERIDWEYNETLVNFGWKNDRTDQITRGWMDNWKGENFRKLRDRSIAITSRVPLRHRGWKEMAASQTCRKFDSVYRCE